MSQLTKQRYVVRLRLNDRDIQTRVLDESPLSVGRANDNDFIIDNLAVSRRHADIVPSPEGPVITDRSSTNGLVVDGSTVRKAVLQNGSIVQIGKHSLHFEAESSPARHAESPAPHLYEATIQVTPEPRLTHPARIVEETDGASEASDPFHPVDTAVFVMGRSDACDVQLDGMLIADYHVEIRVDEGIHRIVHIGGRRKVKVNGETVSERVLQDGDRIEVAGRRFRFYVSD